MADIGNDSCTCKGASVDPRVERSRQIICEAAVAELAEVGYGAMTIESIAKRAGVGKATVYRHWDGKLDLVESALNLMKDEMVVPTNGTVRERLRHVLGWLADNLGHSTGLSGCLPAMVSASQYDQSVRAFHHRFSGERRRLIVELIQEGIDSGEITSSTDAELLAEIVIGPIFYRRLMTPTPLDADRVGHVIDHVI